MSFDRLKYIEEIERHPDFHLLISEFHPEASSDTDSGGTIVYNANAVKVSDGSIGFAGYKTHLNDEELVRALLLLRLHSDYLYPLDPRHIEIEKPYGAPGRPKKDVKGGSADIVVYDDERNPFLFIECKTPVEYRRKATIEGQLFQLSKLEKKRPTYLVWATALMKNGDITDTVMVISTNEFPNYEDWEKDGEPCGNVIPKCYGETIKRRYANVEVEDETLVPLDLTSDEVFFSSLAEELHDVIWGGGGTNNNEVFSVITKLFLCKIVDELEAEPGAIFEFQVQYQGSSAESATALTERMNALYRKAELSYLGVESTNDAFDSNRIKPSKILYVVSRIEGISLTRNLYEGDLLGSFFESVVSHGFTQTKGQFFTPPKLIDFMLDLSNCVERAKETLRSEPDGRGVHRLPSVIDPSCGVGSFLVRYMQRITNNLANEQVRESLGRRAKEAFDRAFVGSKQTNWALECLYAIENNYDLGLAAKVNMILHGDGSMNTWVASGLLPFSKYAIADRSGSFLGATTDSDGKMNESFDLVLSNPPFSVSLTNDDKKEIKDAFSGILGLSEDLFIERWYQLLKPGKGMFCCVLPESVCDTSTERKTRLFLLLRFKIKAVISLPYLAFQPYTSVKTCVVLAEKRSTAETEMLINAVKEASCDKVDKHVKLVEVLTSCGIMQEPIFMAEPLSIGYKRRKGLPDLETENDLNEVSERYHAGNGAQIEPSLRYGFWTTVEAALSRTTLRFDPKYRWLWDVKKGKVGTRDHTQRISDFVRFYKLNAVEKGSLPGERLLVDLDCVNPSSLSVNDNAQLVTEIDSDKVDFSGADIVMPKLRAYLGKALPSPPKNAVGSPEWIGAVCSDPDQTVVVSVFLNSDRMCEALRCLQSGKQHPRIHYEELNDLFIDVDLSGIDRQALYEDLSSISSDKESELYFTNRIFGILRLASTDRPRKLSSLFKEHELTVFKSGPLEETRKLIDLKAVSLVSNIDENEVEFVDSINSDKVLLSDAQIVVSKLESYLGKAIANPPEGSIGSNEWVGLDCAAGIEPIVGVYLITLPEMREAYRMLQSGKRHARINVNELLELEVCIDPDRINSQEILKICDQIAGIRNRIRWLAKTLKEFDY